MKLELRHNGLSHYFFLKYKKIFELYEYFLEHPEQMKLHLFELQANENLHQLVCDYIACMTDNFALETYIQVFVPKRIV